MRIQIASSRVYDTDSPAALLRLLHDTSQDKQQPYRKYLEGFVERLRPMKVWLEVPPTVYGASDDDFAAWLAGEMMRLGRWKETDAPTEEEKEAKAAAAAEAKKAAAAKAAAAKAAAAKAAPAKAE